MVYLQIHSTNELPIMKRDSNIGKDGNAIFLKSGHEYSIQLTPFGQSVTHEFIKMSREDRKCILSNEIPEMSRLRSYSKQNCKLECKVNYAISKCDCIPWDFPLKSISYTM